MAVTVNKSKRSKRPNWCHPDQKGLVPSGCMFAAWNDKGSTAGSKVGEDRPPGPGSLLAWVPCSVGFSSRPLAGNAVLGLLAFSRCGRAPRGAGVSRRLGGNTLPLSGVPRPSLAAFHHTWVQGHAASLSGSDGILSGWCGLG